jgi:hypothetical protein
MKKQTEVNTWTPRNLVFGVRHKRAFRFMSYRGRLIDSIIALQGKNGFPPDCFQGVEWKNDETLFTMKGERGVLLQFSLDGFVLTYDLEKNEDLNSRLCGGMAEGVMETAFEIAEVGENIDRLGMIHEFVFPRNGKAASELQTMLLKIPFDSQGSTEGLQLRTTLRYSEAKSMTTGKTNDYKNVIISIASKKGKDVSHEKSEEIVLGVDFQVYFDPPRSSSHVDVGKHVDAAVSYCNKLNHGSLKSVVTEA